MFRIKNTRNSTVAKHNNVPTPLTTPIPHSIPNHSNADTGKHRQLPTRSLVRRNENLRIKVPLAPIGQSRMGLSSKARQTMPVTKKAALNVQQQAHPKREEGKMDEGKQVREEQKKAAAHVVYGCPQIAQNYIKAQESEQKLIQQQTLQSLKERQRLKKEQQEQISRQAQNQRIAIQEKRRREEQEEAMQKKERELRLKRQQQQQQARNEAKMQEMLQRVNARRRAREEERERRTKLQKQAQGQQLGGMVALSDPLAHVEMSEAAMDAQVEMLLRMKFAGFPNREAIERQAEQLQRINRSCLLARADPNNPLLRGLSNFRIQLFNRVGELIVQAQAQLGPTASGLQVIQADSRNYPAIKGAEVTRGMEGHFSTLSKKTLAAAEECPICLCEVEAGRRVYDVACGHKFHEKCLQEWLRTSANCPACRYNVKFGR